MFDLKGKVALVTGGNRGIGLGMAEALAGAGADIVIWGRDRDRNEQALEGLRPLAPNAIAQCVDVSKEAQVVAGMAEILQRKERVDAVFANAGVTLGPMPFENEVTERFDSMIAVNVAGVLWTLREAARHMRTRAEAGDPGGSLVAVSSLGAIHGIIGGEVYSLCKASLGGLIRSIAVEYARYEVRANVILPGWVLTEMNPELDADKRFESVKRRVPLRRWGQPSDFGGIAVYLASDASRYHTADNFLIDGGYSVF